MPGRPAKLQNVNFRYDGEADLAVDLDADGHIVGIEIFAAARSLHPTMIGPA